MTKLDAKTPAFDILPLVCGPWTMSDADLGVLSLICPYKGKSEDVAASLQNALGVGFPAPNESLHSKDCRIIWFGRECALLCGVPCPDLHHMAAVTDQSDGWVSVTVTGKGTEDVLARLVPVDLRPQHFAQGATLRTMLGHMQVSITRLAEDELLILGFRSMALTLVDDIKEAMEAVAARG